MRKAQTIVEYTLALLIAIALCMYLFNSLNRSATIIHVTGGVETSTGEINVPPMANENESE